MLKEKQRVNGPILKIIITIIIFTHSSDVNPMLSHHKPMIIFIISLKERERKETGTERQRGEKKRERD